MLFAVYALAYYLAVSAAPGRPNAAYVPRETLTFEILADLWHIWPYSQEDLARGPDSVMQSGASPGPPVGNINGRILLLWSIVDIPCLFFRSAICCLTVGPKHPKTPFF